MTKLSTAAAAAALIAAASASPASAGGYGYWDGYAPSTVGERYAASVVGAYVPPLEPRIAVPAFDPNVSGYRPEFGVVGWYGRLRAAPVAVAPAGPPPAYAYEDLPPPPPPGCGC